jgi:hypothetical protein
LASRILGAPPSFLTQKGAIANLCTAGAIAIFHYLLFFAARATAMIYPSSDLPQEQ